MGLKRVRSHQRDAMHSSLEIVETLRGVEIHENKAQIILIHAGVENARDGQLRGQVILLLRPFLPVFLFLHHGRDIPGRIHNDPVTRLQRKLRGQLRAHDHGIIPEIEFPPNHVLVQFAHILFGVGIDSFHVRGRDFIHVLNEHRPQNKWRGGLHAGFIPQNFKNLLRITNDATIGDGHMGIHPQNFFTQIALESAHD